MKRGSLLLPIAKARGFRSEDFDEELTNKCKLNEAMRFRVGPIQSGLRKTHLLDAKWTRAYFKTRYGTNMSDNDIQSKLDAMPQEEQELFLTQVDADAFVVLAE